MEYINPEIEFFNTETGDYDYVTPEIQFEAHYGDHGIGDPIGYGRPHVDIRWDFYDITFDESKYNQMQIQAINDWLYDSRGNLSDDAEKAFILHLDNQDDFTQDLH